MTWDISSKGKITMGSTTYRVVMSGEIIARYETELVAAHFAKLFKLTPEKADALVGTKRVLQEGIALELAKTYEDKLKGIGLGVAIEKELALVEETEPTTESKPESIGVASTVQASAPATRAAPGMVCPKCRVEQTKAEQCTGCGVFMSKVLTQQTELEPSVRSSPSERATPAQSTASKDVVQPEANSIKTLAVPALVALAGALLWYWVAMTFERELGVVAWLIGGAVGACAAAIGAKGETTGIICGVLVVLSIFGGKYMTTSAYQSMFIEQLSSSSESGGDHLREIYDEQISDAALFSETVSDNESLRQFMVDTGYTEADHSADVSDEEIAGFREYSEPDLKALLANRPRFDQWRESMLDNTLTEYSTLDFMLGNLGLLDILFLFFGVGTAFRLGRGTG
ncbi:MAG: plasmid maintenance system antidote protein VapI [Gammaproteobacteria bacterium]